MLYMVQLTLLPRDFPGLMKKLSFMSFSKGRKIMVGDDVPEGKCHSRKDSIHGSHQMELLSKWDLQMPLSVPDG